MTHISPAGWSQISVLSSSLSLHLLGCQTHIMQSSNYYLHHFRPHHADHFHLGAHSGPISFWDLQQTQNRVGTHSRLIAFMDPQQTNVIYGSTTDQYHLENLRTQWTSIISRPSADLYNLGTHSSLILFDDQEQNHKIIYYRGPQQTKFI
jgi:hypothetical protein